MGVRIPAGRMALQMWWFKLVDKRVLSLLKSHAFENTQFKIHDQDNDDLFDKSTNTNIEALLKEHTFIKGPAHVQNENQLTDFFFKVQNNFNVPRLTIDLL